MTDMLVDRLLTGRSINFRLVYFFSTIRATIPALYVGCYVSKYHLLPRLQGVCQCDDSDSTYYSGQCHSMYGKCISTAYA